MYVTKPLQFHNVFEHVLTKTYIDGVLLIIRRCFQTPLECAGFQYRIFNSASFLLIATRTFYKERYIMQLLSFGMFSSLRPVASDGRRLEHFKVV
jgi:hypothetical protein